MEDRYLYDTFGAMSSDFDEAFTRYLNDKRRDHWKVKFCSYCHGDEGDKTYASCVFKRKS